MLAGGLSGCIKWKPFDSYKGGFSVEAPGQLKEVSQSEYFRARHFNGKVYRVFVRGIEFGVAYSKYADIINSAEPRRVLGLLKKFTVKKTNAQLISNTPIDLGDHPGIALHLKANIKGKKREAYLRLFIHSDRDRFYYVYSETDPGKHNKKWNERFFRSFRFIKSSSL
jgi:hypothetical protein